MSHIHYKFSSKLSYDTVVFDGQRITLNELKRHIMGKEKLRAGDCDLQITNAQTKEEYTDSDSVIPRSSSVIVRRIPISSTKTHKNEQSEVQLHYAFGASRAMDDYSSTGALSFFSKMQMANLVDADVSEEDKIKAMINQSSYDSMNVNTKPSSALFVNYTCYRCGNPGHHIRNCPAKGQDKNNEVPLRIKKSTGIPRSFMVEVDDPNMKGAKLTNCGRYAIPAIDAEAYAIGKKEKPPFLPKEQPESEHEDDPIPSELLCLICNELLTDAVVIPCCGNSYCDECIRTALLESEYHICPICDQSEVSPDTLIANKFLRQTVNNFKKEQGYAKSGRWRSATSQSQNLTPTPTPVPTPPPLPMQSQPQKPQQSSHSQQDSVLDEPQAANTPLLSQGTGVPPATTDPASDNDTAGTSLQPLQSQLELCENETEGKTCDDSASASSVKVLNKDPTDAPSQPLTPDNHTLVAEKPQTVNVSQDNQQHASSGPTTVYPESSVSLESSSSSSACPSGGKTESNTQQLSTISSTSSSSTYSTTLPPLFPSPLFHTYLSAQQSHSTYPPRYPPASPIWTLPAPQGAPQGAPIPSLCSSTTANTSSSIPCLIPQEWYRYQRKKKDRSPHRASNCKHSSSHSKSSRAKASCSYSRSSSRSVSRSRSRSRSRHRSPYSHHKNLHTHSCQPSSYSYGYKRSHSPTPSSSSSPRRHYQSRSKAPSGRKDHHHSRHHSKRISSSSNHSRRRAERSGREAAHSEDSVSRNTYTSQNSTLELDRELQWKKEYKEWYEKYFSSFSQLHQLPIPFHRLPPPPPPPEWVSTEGSRKQSHISSDSCFQPQGRRPAEIDGCSPSSEVSSDSRSPPSHSSSSSRSTLSQSCSDSSSSLSYKASDSRSPPSQSSSDGCSTPSEDRAQLTTFPERHSEKSRHKPVTLTKSNEKMKLQGPNTDNKQLKKLENSSSLKHEEKEKKLEEKRQESSPPDVANCTHESRKDKKRHNSGPQASKDGTQIQDKATISTALETDQPVLKQNQPLEKDCESKFIESNLERVDCWKRGKNLYSKERERQHKGKPSKEPDGMDKEREESPGGSKLSDCRSEKNRKRKGEDLEKNKRESSLQSSRQMKTKTAEEPENHLSEFLKPLDREKQKTEKKLEKKTSPLTRKDIWEEGMKVKPQKKISININLDGKRKEGNTGKQNFLENVSGKSQGNINYTENRDEEEKVNRHEVNEKEFSRNQGGWSEDKLKQGEGETRLTWDTFTFSVDNGKMGEKIPGKEEDTVERKDDKEEEDLDLWHCALTGVEESLMGKEEEERVRDDDRDREMGASQKEQENGGETWREGLMESVKMRMRDEDTVMISSQRCNEGHQDTPYARLNDGSSTSVVGSCEGTETQEKSTEVKTLKKYTQDRWKELVQNQVPRSKCKTEDEGKTRVHTDSVFVTLPQPSATNSKAEGDEDQRRERHREKERNSAWSWSYRSVAPSSGKDRVETNVSAGADRETRKERERQRNRERGRERERQQDSKRSKERIREEGSGRDRDQERKSVASSPTRTVPTSSHFYSFSTSQDAERRERRHGGSQGSNKSSSCPSGKFTSFRNRESSTISRAPELANQNAYKTQRDLSLNLKYKDKDYFHYHSNHQDPSWSDRNKDKAPGTHHSQPSLSHSYSKGKDLLPFESSRYPQREAPNLGFMQGKNSKVGKGEWNPNKADKLVKEGKGERENREMPARQGGGSWWEDETDDKVGRECEREGGRELEEGEMLSSQSSSVGSSPSQGNSKDDKGTEKEKKQKCQKKEKQEATPERLQEGELKKYKHKKSKKSREGTDEETGGEGGRQVETKINPLSSARM